MIEPRSHGSRAVVLLAWATSLLLAGVWSTLAAPPPPPGLTQLTYQCRLTDATGAPISGQEVSLAIRADALEDAHQLINFGHVTLLHSVVMGS